METDIQMETKQEESEEYEDYCPFKLDMGYTPKPEEIAQDETVSAENTRISLKCYALLFCFFQIVSMNIEIS